MPICVKCDTKFKGFGDTCPDCRSGGKRTFFCAKCNANFNGSSPKCETCGEMAKPASAAAAAQAKAAPNVGMQKQARVIKKVPPSPPVKRDPATAPASDNVDPNTAAVMSAFKNEAEKEDGAQKEEASKNEAEKEDGAQKEEASKNEAKKGNGAQKEEKKVVAKAGVCSICGEKIVGQYLVLDGMNMHPECFKCEECGTQLTGEYGIRDGKKMCLSCGKAPSRATTVSNFGNCWVCKKDLGSTYVSDSKGHRMHSACFTCSQCGSELAQEPHNGKYVEKEDGSWWCAACSPTRASVAQSPCKACGKTISGKYLTVDGNCYHPECFVCAKCGDSLAQGFSKIEGKDDYFCGTCIHDVVGA